MKQAGSVPVALVGTRTEAELIVGMLSAHGLSAAVSADDLGRLDLALQAQGVRVLVPAQDAAEARRLLDERQDSPPGGTPPNAVQRWLLRLFGGSHQ
jgi:hypothetical protein